MWAKIVAWILPLLGFKVNNFTKYIAFSAILALLGTGTYIYYAKSQSQIKKLIEENSKQEIALALQKKTIEDMELNAKVKTFILKEVYEELAAARNAAEEPEPESPITNPETGEPFNLNDALERELGITEEFLNKQYNDNNKCTSLYSGVPIEKLEKDKNEQTKLMQYCYPTGTNTGP